LTEEKHERDNISYNMLQTRTEQWKIDSEHVYNL